VATTPSTSIPDDGRGSGREQDDRLVEVLGEEECLALLGSAVIGRLAYTQDAMPAMQPSSFTVLAGEVLIPVRPGSRVAVASHGTIVAFEVDDVDVVRRTGWHVTVIGPARVVTGADVTPTSDGRGIRPRVRPAGHCYIAVRITLVRGCRVRHAGADVLRREAGGGVLDCADSIA
jgi:hypothetical protein